MTKCLLCQNNPGNIRCEANYVWHICGQSDCRAQFGETVGDWILNHWEYVEGKAFLELTINSKKHRIQVDKRVLKGLGNRIMEIVMK